MKSAIKYFFVLVFLTEFLAGQDSTKTKHWVIEPFGGMGQIPKMDKRRNDGYQYNFFRNNNGEVPPFATTKLSYVTHLGFNVLYRLEKRNEFRDIDCVDFGINIQWFNYKVNYHQPDYSMFGNQHTMNEFYVEQNDLTYYINRLNLGFSFSNGSIYPKGYYFGYSIGAAYQTHIFKKEITNLISNQPWPHTGTTQPQVWDEKIKNYVEDDVSSFINLQLGYRLKKSLPYVFGQMSSYNILQTVLPINFLFSWGIGCKILLK